MKKRKLIKVIECIAYGPQFANLTPGSIHETVAPPSGEMRAGGVWVQGIGEPVKLLLGEYERINDEQERCCICGGELRKGGHDAHSVASFGRCCDACNYGVVLPKRIELSKRSNEQRTGEN